MTRQQGNKGKGKPARNQKDSVGKKPFVKRKLHQKNHLIQMRLDLTSILPIQGYALDVKPMKIFQLVWLL